MPVASRQTNARVVATQNGIDVQTVSTDTSGVAILAQVPPGATTITAVIRVDWGHADPDGQSW